MAKTRECCSALSLRRTGDYLHVSLHKGFKIRLAGIVPVFIEFTEIDKLEVFSFIEFFMSSLVNLCSAFFKLRHRFLSAFSFLFVPFCPKICPFDNKLHPFPWVTSGIPDSHYQWSCTLCYTRLSSTLLSFTRLAKLLGKSFLLQHTACILCKKISYLILSRFLLFFCGMYIP